MVRARLLVVAVLMLAVPMEAVAAIAAELCMTLGYHEADVALAHDQSAGPDNRVASAHDQAAHDHAANDASDSQYCELCEEYGAAASISAVPKVSIPAVPPAGVVPALLPSPGRKLPRELDRPPLAL